MLPYKQIKKGEKIMSYGEEKEILLQKQTELLKKYNELRDLSMQLSVEMFYLIGDGHLNKEEALDWETTVTNSDDYEKFSRLAIALQYVENPTDKKVITVLEENIRVNNSTKEQVPKRTK